MFMLLFFLQYRRYRTLSRTRFNCWMWRIPQFYCSGTFIITKYNSQLKIYNVTDTHAHTNQSNKSNAWIDPFICCRVSLTMHSLCEREHDYRQYTWDRNITPLDFCTNKMVSRPVYMLLHIESLVYITLAVFDIW